MSCCERFRKLLEDLVTFPPATLFEGETPNENTTYFAATSLEWLGGVGSQAVEKLLSDDVTIIRAVIDYNAGVEGQRDTAFQLLQADPEGGSTWFRQTVPLSGGFDEAQN